tara:strand:- start:15101 stop:16825 length:1725 start_codon:yes stop_codon:yes gene_type:complete
MISNITNIISFLFYTANKRDKKNLILLIFFVTIASIMEFLSISAIVPLISTLLNTEIEFTIFNSINNSDNFFLNKINLKKLIIYIFIVLIFISAIFRLLVLRSSLRFSSLISANIASKIFTNTINQSYKSITSQNSNILISGVTEKMNLAQGIIFQLFNFFSSFIIGFAIIIGLLFYNFILTSLLVLAFGTSYLLIAYLFKIYLSKNSQILSKYSDYRVKFLQESVGSIREIILDSLHSIFSKIFKESENKYRLSSANVAVVGSSPKIVMETLGIIVLLLFSSFYFDGKFNQNIDLIISLGVFAFAANKLLPLFNTIYTAWVFMSGAEVSIKDLKELVHRSNEKLIKFEKKKISTKPKKIELKNLSFYYVNNENKVFNKLNLEIKLKSKIGVVGETGKGKSTLIDLLMGLLKPTNGIILLDDTELDDSLIVSWQNKLAHVPQNIFLINDTIRKNVAFGIPDEDIDENKLEKSLKIACLDYFINETKSGVDTELGENGINISGGQKQRIGIARALYKSKEILIFDEATSALDYNTEQKIMSNIFNNYPDITLISISHRVETFKNFDEIINLNNFK